MKFHKRIINSYIGNPEVDCRIAFKFNKEADVKDIIDKVYKWTKDKLSEEKSTEIQLKKDLPNEVEKIIDKEEGVEESKGLVKRIIDTVIKKLKDEGSVLITEEKPIPKDKEEIKEEIEEGEDGAENDVVTNITNSAKAYKLLWIQYRDKKAKVTERSVEPWEIDATKGYLYAHDPKFTKHHNSDVGTRKFILASIMNSKLTNKNYLKKDRWEMRIV